jgi:Protein of unknown function (DUF2721)
MNPFATDYGILSMMIAPALFMTATGSLILSSNNRLSRIVDRIRVLINLLDQVTLPDSTHDFPELRLQFYHEELRNLERRGHRIRSATSLLYLAFAMFVAASLVIGLDLYLTFRVPKVPTGLALAGVASLFWASMNLFREARTAVRTVSMEIDFLRSLHVERDRLKTSNPASPRTDN